MPFNEQDSAFLNKVTEAIEEPIFPGLLEGIIRLEKENLGRAVYVERNNSAGEMVRREVGYILPLDRSQAKHLVIFVNGSMAITEPVESKDKETYQLRMQPNMVGIKIPSQIPIDELSYRWLDGNSWLKSKVTMRNDRDESIVPINEAVEKALLASYELRDQKKVAANEAITITADVLVRKLDIVFSPVQLGEEEES